MKSPKVSIIIPTFRQTDLFKRSLLSAVNQTYNNIEVIIIDDNENENISQRVLEILDEISSSKVSYYRNEKNRGSVYSRNKGIEKTKSEYVTFLDDDDYYQIDKVERQVAAMIEGDCLFSVCNITLEFNDGRIERRNRRFLSRDEKLHTKHMKYHIAATSTFMFETEFIKEIGGFLKLDYGDDYYLMEQAINRSDKFVHANFQGVNASINSDIGLSSWNNKIIMEKELFKHKNKYFDVLSKKDKAYIRMRHYLVLSHSYLKGKRTLVGVKYLMKSIVRHPLGFVRILTGNDK